MDNPEDKITELMAAEHNSQISEKVWQREIKYFHTLYIKTSNPLYVWQVMSLYCLYQGRFPLPSWCQHYFCAAAQGLFSLSRRQDIRRPERMEWGSLKPLPPISAKLALSLIPVAIGLRGHQGKSMLLDFNSRLTKDYEVSLYENLRANGVSRREATDILLRVTNRDDERTLRRSFAASETRMSESKSKAGRRISQGRSFYRRFRPGDK